MHVSCGRGVTRASLRTLSSRRAGALASDGEAGGQCGHGTPRPAEDGQRRGPDPAAAAGGGRRGGDRWPGSRGAWTPGGTPCTPPAT